LTRSIPDTGASVLLRELTWVATQTNTPAEVTVIDGKTSRRSNQTVCACFYCALRPDVRHQRL